MGKKKTRKKVYELVEEVAAYGSKRLFTGTQGDRRTLEFYTEEIIKAVKGKGGNDCWIFERIQAVEDSEAVKGKGGND